jgi:hypothetical protein
MKTIISAIALVLAAPAAAQSTTPTNPHAGHTQGQPMDHSQHQQATDHSKHEGGCCKGDDAMACCEKAKKDGKVMPCCDGKDDEAAPAPEGGHGSHDH